jgi:formylglycine-generating enzyme
MSRFDLDSLLAAGAAGLDGDSADFQVAADHWLSHGDEATALVALDRAYGLASEDPTITAMRAAFLDRFAIEEHGLIWRYVPAGTFLMGSITGDPDERPVHPVRLDAYWIAELPITWSAFAQLAGWTAPPNSHAQDPGEQGFYLSQANKIRMQYCETETKQARDWHAHLGGEQASKLFGMVPRQRPDRPIAYDCKPMVAVGWADAEMLAARLSTEEIEYALPSEAEWEKAARGGLIGRRYPWGDDPPTPERCDFDHFGDFRIADPRQLPPNGYGLHGMAGGVWEWTATVYDALAYGGAETPGVDPAVFERRSNDPPPADQPQQRVMRGGSWADAAAAVTVSFRGAAIGTGWERGWGDSFNPNVGFRLVRRARRR